MIFNTFFKKSMNKNNSTNKVITNINNLKKNIILDEKAKLVLPENQQKLVPLLEDFSTTHFLWWWTAIALYLWHRESIDFDFFSKWNQWTYSNFKKRIQKSWFNLSQKDDEQNFYNKNENQEEFHVDINWVKFTAFNYYRTLYNDQEIKIKWEDTILWWLKIASLEELMCMKLFSTMSRNKFKDAVDIYYILKNTDKDLEYYLDKSEKIYFKDIIQKNASLVQLISKEWDTTEEIKYIDKNHPSNDTVIEFLYSEASKLMKR